MKKIALVLLLFTCGGLLTFAEIKQINEQKINYMTEVVALKNDLSEGVEIKEQDLQIISIPKEIYHDNYYKDINEIVGNTLAIKLAKSTIISRELLLEKSFFLPKKGNAMTSLKLTPEEMLCWMIENGEEVQVVHISLEGELATLGDVTIKGIFDQSLESEVGIKNIVPTYVLVEGSINIIESIISKRGSGRIEVIKITNN